MNYPNGIKKNKNSNKIINYGNRGMSLEKDINCSNLYYLECDIAHIYKKPTPIKIIEVDRLQKGRITGFFETPSTTDYNGLYKGHYIDFEAKETKNKTSFPLSNIHAHQIKHMKNIFNHKGIAFLIVRFTTINETYLLFINDLLKFLENNNKTSIPLEYFKNNGELIKDSFNPRIDYLKIIDKYIGGINND